MTTSENAIDVQIRLALVGEAEQLTALSIASKARWGYTPEQVAAWRGELAVQADDIFSGRVHVAVVEEEVVAVMVLLPAKMTWKLSHLFVAEAWMHQGIGKKLFQFAVELAQQQDARAISINADPNAERFYLSCGAIRSYSIAAPIPENEHRIRPQMLFMIPAQKTL
ncbi:GNAT family N-acetyltransferase [Sapientia aquatica]|nr:GNAT family N-acetyltransferase [Sapientia aquatica]